MRLPTVVVLFAMSVPVPAQDLPQAVTIDEAVAEAVEHNLDLAAAKYDISVAETRRITAALRPNPVLSLSADHLDLLGTDYNKINGAGPPEYAVRTDFLLERAKKREKRIEVAENDQSIARLKVLNTMRGVVLDVQNAFIEVQAAKDSLMVAEGSLKAMDSIVDINAVRVKAGDLAQVELLRSRVAALQFQTAAEQARLRLIQAKNRLHGLMGRTTRSANLDVLGTLRRDPAIPGYDALLEQAMNQRPDLQGLMRLRVRSQADLRLQLAQGKIDYTLGAEYRRQDGINGRGNSLGFFLAAPLPVFNRNQGEILRAQRELDQGAARIRALEQSLKTEMTNAYEQYQTSKNLLEGIERNMLEQSREVLKITEYSYRRGEASLLELLDAQRAFNDTMQSYNEARANYARSLYLIDSITAANVSKQVIP